MFKSARVLRSLSIPLAVLAVSCTGQLGGQKAECEGSVPAGKNGDTDSDSERFAGLLSGLKGVDDVEGQSALYNSAVVLGMECWSDSANGHSLRDIPFVLAGQGSGHSQTGRIVDMNDRNNNDLLISVQDVCGIESDVYGLASLCTGPIV